MNHQIDKLKVMRGMAALMVAFLHGREIAWIGIQQYWSAFHAKIAVQSLIAYASFPAVWGSIGVPIFFVISGYCIHYSYSTRLLNEPARKFQSLDFLKRRFIRIYPVLIGALIVTCLLDAWSKNFLPNSPHLGDGGWKSFLVNLFALQGIAGSTYGSNSALWTLSLEIQFYLVYPLLIFFRRKTTLNTVSATIVIVTLLSYYFFERRGIIIFTSYYASWFAGAYIAELRTKTSSSPTRRPGLLMGVSILFLLAGCVTFSPTQYLSFQLWAVSFSIFFWLSFRLKFGKWLRFFEWVGAFSYSLYIVHLPFFVLLGSVLFHSVRQENIMWTFLFLLLLLPFAIGFYYIFERPFAQFLERNRGMTATAR